MALISCPECGREKVSDQAKMCPDCGFPISEQTILDRKKVGDILHFGEVTFAAGHGGIYSSDTAWQVLAIEANKMLVIAKDVIEVRSYNYDRSLMVKDGVTKRREYTDWEHSKLRQWLNGKFFEGLPQAMRDAAMASMVVNYQSDFFGRPKRDGNTRDKVFYCLSMRQGSIFVKTRTAK